MLDDVRTKMLGSVNYLKDELRKIRAGRANPDMVKNIMVSAYDTQMPIEQLANINVVDPTLITIQPWDKTVIAEISKAIQSSDVGINPSIDGDLIRLPIPSLTSERRQEYVKLMKQKVEEARISIRQKRKDFLLDLEQMQKKENLPEEEKKRHEKGLQSLVEEMNTEVESISQSKEEELLKV